MKRAMVGAVSVLVFMCACGVALATHEAAGGGSHGAAFGRGEIFQIINFVLLVILLVYVYKKYAGGGFEKRSQHIKIAIEEAQQAKRKAEALFADYRSRLDNVDKEIGDILDRAREQAQRDREQIIKEARAQAEKIVRQAELTARQEVVQAKQRLREEAVDLAAQLAVEVLRRSVTQEDHARLVDMYHKKLGEMN